MNKSDFKRQFDFDALCYATEVSVTFPSSATKSYYVQNYWPSPDTLVDVMECIDPMASIDAPEDERFPIFYVPSPEIVSITILASSSQPNHGSHPEVAFIIPRIDEVFK